MTMLLTPSTELEARLCRVQERLRRDHFDGALIVGNSHLFYLTGTIQQGHLLLPVDGEPLLLVRRDLARARAESALPNIEPLLGFRELPAALARLGLGSGVRLGLELDLLPVNAYRRFATMLPEVEFHDCAPLLRQVRSVKSPFEIERQREAAVQTDIALRAGAAVIREGVPENVVAAEIVGSLFRNGHQGLLRFRAFNQEMFFVHCFAGPDAGVASYLDVPMSGRGLTPAVAQGAGTRPIGRGEPIVIDVGGAVDGYGVDQTRTLSLGPLPARFADGYRACRAILDRMRVSAVPGVVTGDLYQEALAMAAEAGLAEVFMGAAPSQVSFIGHGIGIEIDELPVLARGAEAVLEEGQVVAIEPKLVFPGEGAVGIEDTFRVGAEGLEPITFSDREIWEL
jgi:Xaa-Pro dipeptidase